MLVIFYILLGLVIVRLLLPHFALYRINRKLARLNGYRGQISAIKMNLLHGRYRVHDLVFHKSDAHSLGGEPFLTASKVDVLIQWKALFQKSLVATVVVDQPELNFMKEAEPGKEEKNRSSLKTQLQQVFPFNINLGIRGGTINYIDNLSKAHVDLEVTDLTVCVHAFSNMPSHESTPARINATARVYEGTCDFTMKLFPMAGHLTFDMNAEVKNINLVLLNTFFRAYAKIDVNAGTFDMYTEVAAKNGAFTGYVKPVIKNLDIIGAEDQNDSLFRKLWERAVAGVYQLVKNKREDQVAAKIPIEGKFDDPHISIFAAVTSILKNAFVRAVHPSIDDVINITSMRASVSKAKGLIQKIFPRKEQAKKTTREPA